MPKKTPTQAVKGKSRPKTPVTPEATYSSPPSVAAPRLGLSVPALHAAMRRHARIVDGELLADLGHGVVAYKLGKLWRVIFPSQQVRGAAGGDASE